MRIITTIMKKSRFLVYVYSQIIRVLTTLSPELGCKTVYRISMGKKLNLSNPRTLNEKLMWLEQNVYKKNPMVKRCIDKCAVRDYVEIHGDGEMLVESYGVWDNAEDIDFDQLPNRFVLKCNHASGFNIVCEDKKTFNRKKAIQQLNKWLRVRNFGVNAGEIIYKGINPKIICEHYIDTIDGNPPKDYKFFCAYGEPKFMFVASDRIGDQTKFDFYTLDWKHIPVVNGHPNSINAIEKPEHMDAMIAACKNLGEEFPIARIDFYDDEGRAQFGEITFLHFGARVPFQPESYDLQFGEMMPSKDEILKRQVK
jgi:hypothetical protein